MTVVGSLVVGGCLSALLGEVSLVLTFEAEQIWTIFDLMGIVSTKFTTLPLTVVMIIIVPGSLVSPVLVPGRGGRRRSYTTRRGQRRTAGPPISSVSVGDSVHGIVVQLRGECSHSALVSRSRRLVFVLGSVMITAAAATLQEKCASSPGFVRNVAFATFLLF